MVLTVAQMTDREVMTGGRLKSRSEFKNINK